MKATFLGHQTWLLSSGDHHILVDPLLMETFGSSENSFCAIYPLRKIDFEKLPSISAVFLSHEHPDHVCLETLAKLGNEVPIYVGPLMLNTVREALEILKLDVREFLPNKELNFGGLSI